MKKYSFIIKSYTKILYIKQLKIGFLKFIYI